MRGGEMEAAASHFLVVVEVGAPLPPATLLDVVGEQPAQPEGVVAEMRTHEKAAARVRIVDVPKEIRQGIVRLVVASRDTMRPTVYAEMQHDRRNVVGEVTIIFAGTQQRMANDHISKQRK